jgi:hypothetical protein
MTNRTVIRINDQTEERVTYTLEATQLWRQVGWVGGAWGRVYAVDDPAVGEDPAGFRALWVLLEDERPAPVEEDVDE